MNLKGYVQWPFPHATTSAQKDVLTNIDWYDYNAYKLIGGTKLTATNQFDLLEPSLYRLELANYSNVLVYNNVFTLNVHGTIVCPNSVKGSNYVSHPVTLPFKNAIQLFYISNDHALPDQSIIPVSNLAFQLDPLEYVIDLSEVKSPGKNEGDAFWKGIYFSKTSMHFLPAFDIKGQMSFINDTRYELEPSAADSNMYYLDMYGQTFRYIRTFSGYQVAFNTFPSYLTDFRINIYHDAVENSFLKGSLLLPFISNTKPFHYTSVLTFGGLHPGYITDIDEFQYTYHADKAEEAIEIKILSAVFADQERLDISLNMNWPYLL